MTAIDALLEQSIEMLAVLRADRSAEGERFDRDSGQRRGPDPGRLNALLDAREKRLGELAEARASGVSATADEVSMLRQLDRDIMSALLEHRNALCRQMRALQFARAADASYHTAPHAAPAYLDRSG